MAWLHLHAVHINPRRCQYIQLCIPEDTAAHLKGPAIHESWRTAWAAVCSHTKHPCEVWLQTSGALVWSTRRYGGKTNKRCHVPLVWHCQMIQLRPLLGDKLGLGCGKAPYINVTDCRLRGQISVSWVKISTSPPPPNKIRWSSIPGLERDTWKEHA